MNYQDCVNICNDLDSPFYESKLIIEGYNVSVFNYRIASYKDFIGRKEMRGLTFVFNTDGSLYNRYFLLEKFFNLNQVEESSYHNVKSLLIRNITNKEDGSIISFIKLPNGKVIAKSKMGFDNEQAIAANNIYINDTKLQEFVNSSLDRNIIPIFEYVAPSNKIVLYYQKEELILISLRNLETGEYLDITNVPIKRTSYHNEYSLDELIEIAKTKSGVEGWVIEFENGYRIKIKTEWYVSLHGILSEDIYRENRLIQHILDDTIDDVLGQIPDTEIETHERINYIINKVRTAINEKMSDIEESYKKFVEIGSDKKKYALNYRDDNFIYVMEMSKGRSSYDLAKDYINKKTMNLMAAKQFLK